MEAQYDKPLKCVVVTSERWSGYTTVDTEDGWEGSSWSGGRLGIDWYHQSHILVTRTRAILCQQIPHRLR